MVVITQKAQLDLVLGRLTTVLAILSIQAEIGRTVWAERVGLIEFVIYKLEVLVTDLNPAGLAV
ncbi:hypothetical protein [Pseudomonas sp. CFBP 13719]|uniref:hypothetical protein n=1 Tax=Pseudomonas sp. CFBP 13719 TaxID=2775303 RepID=UPI00177E57F1|nr:hypothetical protein [Pseudomonas sp. CFBP 13719]MBD8615016.1 hypothetical protein [Pseudomonas putida]MBD8681301.1 hypothetical protein [Pseudomonas sp. CFBP 13719]